MNKRINWFTLIPIRIILLVVVFTFSFTNLFGQSIFQRHYTTKDGLPSNELYDIEEDDQGRLWFSSDNGICYFDGKDFHNVQTSPNIDNTIFNLYKDDDRIWCLSMDGKLQSLKGEQIKECSFNDSLELHSNVAKIIYGFYCSNNEIYYGRYGSGLIKIDNKNIISTVIPSIGEIDEPFFHFTQVNDCIIPSNQGKNKLANPIIPTIIKFNLADTTFLFEFPEFNYNAPISRNLILNNEKWLCSYDNWLFTLSRNGIEVIKRFDNVIISMHKDQQQGIWIGFKDGGGMEYFPYGIEQIEQSETMLSNHSVSQIFTDSQHNLWVTTLNKGVYFSANPYSRLFFENQTQNHTINDILTTSNECYALFENGELYRINEDSITYFLSPDQNLKYHQIDMLPWKDLIVFGNKSNPGYLLSPRSSMYTPVPKTNFNAAFILIEKKIYFNVIGGGIVELDENKYENYFQAVRGFRIDCIFQDSTNTLWLGNEQGIFKFDGTKLINYSKAMDHFRVLDIDRLNEKSLILAVKQKGNFLLNTKSGQITKIKEHKDFPIINNDVYGTTIWSCTSNKIYKSVFDPSTNEFLSTTEFDQFDGVVGTDIQEIKTTENYIWTNTELGLNRITKEQLTSKNYSPNLLIKNFSIKNGRINKGACELNYGNNFFQLTIESIDLSRKKQLDYYYKLDGLHEKYNTLSGNKIEFNSLPPGNYKLHFYASNGKSSSDVITINIVVSPPFWLTWWGILVISLTVVLITALTVKRILLQKHKKHLSLKTAEKEKIQLKLKALKAQMNPHFMFNSLNSIQYYILENDTDSAIIYLSKFSKLIRLILEESDVEYGPLSREIDILNLYLELEQVRLENKFVYHIEIDKTVKTEHLLIPSLLIQPIIENSVWHGISAKDEKGVITVHFTFENEELICTVTDNGIGRTKAREKKTSNQYKKSMGMSISRNRLKLLHSKINHQINIESEDRISGDINSGTKVKIRIPFQKTEKS